MKTTLQFRGEQADFDAYKTLAGLTDTSMSALMDGGLNKLADNPDLLAKVIAIFLKESGQHNGDPKKQSVPKGLGSADGQDHTHIRRNFTIEVSTMEKMDKIVAAIGIPKEKIAIMVIRAQRRHLI